MKIIAIDPSLINTGIAIMNTGKLQHCYNIKTKKPKGNGLDNRLQLIAEAFHKILSITTPEVLVIESQYLGRNVQSMSKVIEVKGILKGVFVLYCLQNKLSTCQMIDINPRTAKQAIGVFKHLKRVESKLAVRDAVCRMFPSFNKFDENIIDAIAIGVAGEFQLNLKNLYKKVDKVAKV